jgi:Flp pilus assembly protein TadD
MPSTEEILQQAWQVHQRGNPSKAEQVYRSVVEKEPRNANAWCYLGIAMHDLKQYAQAVRAYENAIKLQPQFPIALNNMGNSLRYLGRVADADAAFQKALDQSPKYFNALRNRGTLHAWTGRIDLAFEYYHQAMQLNPNDAELHRNLGVIHLLQGNFAEGWREYRYRWQCAEAIQHAYRQPKWSGEPLEGKTILLYAEQGLGDTIHFVRFAKELKKLGAKTIVHIQPQLLAILQSCKGIDELIPNSLRVESPFDYHCSLIDVADVMQIDATSIPCEIPYLTASPNLVQYWQSAWSRSLPHARIRIGIHWQGNADHQADMFRSFPLQCMLPLEKIEGVQLVSLQKGNGTEQLRTWPGKETIFCLPEDVDTTSGAFMDTAAIMRQLDYVVTSDTSIAHLAGALGVQTCIVLGFTPDWRWLQLRPDSPWYPTIRLFRQTEIGEWTTVLQEVANYISNQPTSSDTRD